MFGYVVWSVQRLKVIVFIRQVLNCCDPSRDRFMFICNLNIKKLNSVPDLAIVEY